MVSSIFSENERKQVNRKYRLFGNEREFINGCCGIICGHFFVICINIFHKTEVQTVILMCLMGQNLIWFKNYDTKSTLMPRKILAKSKIDHQNLHLINGNITTVSGHFCAISLNIFYKTEVQTVILKCWASLNHDWYNSYDTKRKKKKQKSKKHKCIFFYNITKK